MSRNAFTIIKQAVMLIFKLSEQNLVKKQLKQQLPAQMVNQQLQSMLRTSHEFCYFLLFCFFVLTVVLNFSFQKLLGTLSESLYKSLLSSSSLYSKINCFHL